MKTRLGDVIGQMRVLPERPGDDVIHHDIIVVWGAQRRIITGSDLLGRLLRDIATVVTPPQPPNAVTPSGTTARRRYGAGNVLCHGPDRTCGPGRRSLIVAIRSLTKCRAIGPTNPCADRRTFPPATFSSALRDPDRSSPAAQCAPWRGDRRDALWRGSLCPSGETCARSRSTAGW